MEVIVKLPNLSALYMTGCRNMTDSALARLVEARPDLRELEFGASPRITDAGLAHLARLRGKCSTFLSPFILVSQHSTSPTIISTEGFLSMT
jgi:hypothetical protein